jgi:hypothetical protein
MIEMFDSLDPATGEVIGTFPAYDGAAVRMRSPRRGTLRSGGPNSASSDASNG